tara:strand:- start:470 stop:724 length:255 start_codon:yes stop_codon:yes gene_type:complete
METSDLEGFDKNIGYFKISNCDDDSSSKSSDSETETETETESETESESSGYSSSKEKPPKNMKGYLKNTKKYKKILFEENFLPE